MLKCAQCVSHHVAPFCIQITFISFAIVRPFTQERKLHTKRAVRVLYVNYGLLLVVFCPFIFFCRYDACAKASEMQVLDFTTADKLDRSVNLLLF